MFVLQPWVSEVGLKMQSILLSGLRAPDTKTSGVKKVVRWMRGLCQVDADPKKQSYMQTIVVNDDLVNTAIDELEYLTCHYAHHFADSLRVVSVFHPDPAVREQAYKIHFLVAEEIFHFVPESDAVFQKRHQDKMVEKLQTLEEAEIDAAFAGMATDKEYQREAIALTREGL